MNLHPDFKDFLRLLHSREVEYLLVGGYAVGYYGYPRATGDMDIWIAVSDKNAESISKVLCEFGMPPAEVDKRHFLENDQIIRMGVPPVRIEVITKASGIDFADCYSRRQEIEIDGVPTKIISIEDLKQNKKAAGRHKDLEDLNHLP